MVMCLSSLKENIVNFILQNCQKQTAPLESTARYISFEWSHHRVLSTDSNVTTTFIYSRFDSVSERVKSEIYI